MVTRHCLVLAEVVALGQEWDQCPWGDHQDLAELWCLSTLSQLGT